MRRLKLLAYLPLLGVAAAHPACPAPQVLPGYESPPAWIELQVRRLGFSDSLAVKASVGFDRAHPNYAQNGEWHVELPTGLTLVKGATGMQGTKQDIAGVHELVIRCEHWGNFSIRASLLARSDSLNWTADTVLSPVRVTADSFEVLGYPTRFGHVGRTWVIDGLFYVRHTPCWLPLDPGENANVEPGFRQRDIGSPPTLHAERTTHMMPAGHDTTYEVPILVAVDRLGRVKAARLNVGLERIPRAMQEAAIGAAWKWKFTPAQSLGRPVSTLYLIRVPVAATARE